MRDFKLRVPQEIVARLRVSGDPGELLKHELAMSLYARGTLSARDASALAGVPVERLEHDAAAWSADIDRRRRESAGSVEDDAQARDREAVESRLRNLGYIE